MREWIRPSSPSDDAFWRWNTDCDIINFIKMHVDAATTTTTYTVAFDNVFSAQDLRSPHGSNLAIALAQVGIELDEGLDEWSHQPTVEFSWQCDAAWFRAKAAKGTALQDIAVMYADD